VRKRTRNRTYKSRHLSHISSLDRRKPFRHLVLSRQDCSSSPFRLEENFLERLESWKEIRDTGCCRCRPGQLASRQQRIPNSHRGIVITFMDIAADDDACRSRISGAACDETSAIDQREFRIRDDPTCAARVHGVFCRRKYRASNEKQA